jgi:hypothetical protein
MATVLEKIRKALGDKPDHVLQDEIRSLQAERSQFAREHDRRQKGLAAEFVRQCEEAARAQFKALVAADPIGFPTDPLHVDVQRLALLAVVAGVPFADLAREAIAEAEEGFELTRAEYEERLAAFDRQIAERQAELRRRDAERVRQEAEAQARALEAEATARLNGGA